MEKVSWADLQRFLMAELFQFLLELAPKRQLRLFVSFLTPGQTSFKDHRQPRIDHKYLANGFGGGCAPTLCQVSTVSRRSVRNESTNCNCFFCSSSGQCSERSCKARCSPCP